MKRSKLRGILILVLGFLLAVEIGTFFYITINTGILKKKYAEQTALLSSVTASLSQREEISLLEQNSQDSRAMLDEKRSLLSDLQAQLSQISP